MRYYAFWYGHENKDYQKSIAETAKWFKAIEGDELHAVVDSDFNGTPEQCAIQKDLDALYYLSLGDCAVICADLVPTKRIDFSNPGAYAVYRNGVPSIEYMASVGEEGRAWFRKIIDEKKRRGIRDCWGFPNKLFQDFSLKMAKLKPPFEIPFDSFTHDRIQSKVKEAKIGNHNVDNTRRQG